MAAIAPRRRRDGCPGAPSDAGTGVEEAERATHGVLDGALGGPAVPQTHFRLGRVHVHVDISTGHMQCEHERRPHAGRQRGTIGGFGGADDAVIAHDAPVDDQQDAARGRPHIGGTFDHPRDVDRSLDVVEIDEPLHVAMSPQLGEPGTQRRDSGQIEGDLAVVTYREMHIATQRADGVHGIHDAAPFRPRATQEFLSCGGVVEQPLHRHGGAAAARRLAGLEDGAGSGAYLRAGAVFRGRFDQQFGNRCDGGQGLAAEPIAAHPDELFGHRDLRRRVP